MRVVTNASAAYDYDTTQPLKRLANGHRLVLLPEDTFLAQYQLNRYRSCATQFAVELFEYEERTGVRV